MNNHSDFFHKVVPELLSRLKPDQLAVWGKMNAVEMLDHLRAGAVLMLEVKDGELLISEEKLPAAKSFLMSGKPLVQHADKPAEYAFYERKDAASFEQTRVDFLEALHTFDLHTGNNPDFQCFHPYFGLLNAEEVRQLQYKHICHHFTQFGLL